jgi:16S rRNA (cytidine1402-2'-O)-methyltransferase
MTRDPQLAEKGHLYLISTPLGNLGDLSFRALELMRSCDKIACEDTRVTGRLLQQFEINKPILSYREHNEAARAEELAESLKTGDSIALLCDAGTPTLSDPGFRLVRTCRRMGIPVVPVPGPCAAIAALSASGLPSNAFYFAGFLPAKKAARVRFFEENRVACHTIILYESCHRIGKCLDDLIETLGENRCICLAREITKRHETFLTGVACHVREQFLSGSPKGEFVLLIAPEDFVL